MKTTFTIIHEMFGMYLLYLVLALVLLTHGVPKVSQVLQEHLIRAVQVGDRSNNGFIVAIFKTVW